MLGEGKVQCYLGLELDRLTFGAVRPETPLPYGVSSRLNELRIATNNYDISDQAIDSHQNFHHHPPLNVLLLGFLRIGGLNFHQHVATSRLGSDLTRHHSKITILGACSLKPASRAPRE